MATPPAAVESFHQVAHGLPVQPLLDVLSANPGLWDLDTRRQSYPGTHHADTRCILLRMPEAAMVTDATGAARAWFTDLTCQDYICNEALWNALDPILEAVVKATKAIKLARVMLVELKVGGEVTEHVDTGAYADHTDRVHVCLQSDGATLDTLAPDGIHWHYHVAPGEAVWLNTKLPHGAHNLAPGDVGRPRVHLIIDVVSPDLRARRNEQPHSIQPELLSECWNDILPLCARHKDEIAHYDDIALNVDCDKYEQLEALGILKLYTVRSLPDWQLIGYEVVMVGPNLHYRDSIQAKVDVLYIAPEHRRGRLGLSLIDYADARLRELRVQVVYHHSKLAFDFGPLLKRLDYEPIETIWGRRLDRE